MEQSSAAESAERAKEVEMALKPLIESFAKHDLASHKDKDVRLLVAVCATQLFRIMAPEPPFEGVCLLVNVLLTFMQFSSSIFLGTVWRSLSQ